MVFWIVVLCPCCGRIGDVCGVASWAFRLWDAASVFSEAMLEMTRSILVSASPAWRRFIFSPASEASRSLSFSSRSIL